MAKSRHVEITSVTGLLRVLSQRRYAEEMMLFRGQTQNWPLIPSIGRHRIVWESWHDFHDDLINEFLRVGHPFFLTPQINNADTWVIAQHHGMPTRLLGASTNPLKALFFAVNNTAHDGQDGIFCIFVMNQWREDLDHEYRKYWDSNLCAFFPRQLTARLTAQEGAFLCYPLPRDRNRLTPIEKLPEERISVRRIVVPAEAKPKLRRELATLGIQYRLLFPDLDGVARSIKLNELGAN